ncbi:MAG: hypothetical protein AAF492_18355, partial [Verrucomicrobiota bacterium]
SCLSPGPDGLPLPKKPDGDFKSVGALLYDDRNLIVDQLKRDQISDINLAEKLLADRIFIEPLYERAIRGLSRLLPVNDYAKRIRGDANYPEKLVRYDREFQRCESLKIDLKDFHLRNRSLLVGSETRKGVITRDLLNRAKLASELHQSGVVLPELFEQVSAELALLPEESRIFKDFYFEQINAKRALKEGEDPTYAYKRSPEEVRKQLQSLSRDLNNLKQLRNDLLEASLEYRQRDAFERNHLTQLEMAVDAAESGVVPDTYRLRQNLSEEEKLQAEEATTDHLPYLETDRQLDTSILGTDIKISPKDFAEDIKALNETLKNTAISTTNEWSVMFNPDYYVQVHDKVLALGRALQRARAAGLEVKPADLNVIEQLIDNVALRTQSNEAALRKDVNNPTNAIHLLTLDVNLLKGNISASAVKKRLADLAGTVTVAFDLTPGSFTRIREHSQRLRDLISAAVVDNPRSLAPVKAPLNKAAMELETQATNTADAALHLMVSTTTSPYEKIKTFSRRPEPAEST